MIAGRPSAPVVIPARARSARRFPPPPPHVALGCLRILAIVCPYSVGGYVWVVQVTRGSRALCIDKVWSGRHRPVGSPPPGCSPDPCLPTLLPLLPMHRLCYPPRERALCSLLSVRALWKMAEGPLSRRRSRVSARPSRMCGAGSPALWPRLGFDAGNGPHVWQLGSVSEQRRGCLCGTAGVGWWWWWWWWCVCVWGGGGGRAFPAFLDLLGLFCEIPAAKTDGVPSRPLLYCFAHGVLSPTDSEPLLVRGRHRSRGHASHIAALVRGGRARCVAVLDTAPREGPPSS